MFMLFPISTANLSKEMPRNTENITNIARLELNGVKKNQSGTTFLATDSNDEVYRQPRATNRRPKERSRKNNGKDKKKNRRKRRGKRRNRKKNNYKSRKDKPSDELMHSLDQISIPDRFMWLEPLDLFSEITTTTMSTGITKET